MAEPVQDDTPILIGARSHPLRDIYHLLLRRPWPVALSVIAASFLTLNAIFACVYMVTGGIAHAEPGSFKDAFFFSVQTFGTIGYGNMYPDSTAAECVVIVESVVSLVSTAISTGLIFSKFSVSSARIVFTRNAVITTMHGVPMLMVRIGNERGDRIYDASLRIALTRTEKPPEGGIFYRMVDLKLARDRAPALTRSFNIMHTIDADSPLAGATAESMKANETELLVTVSGTDSVTLQPVHASARILDSQILIGHRFADVLSEAPDGRLILDVRKFHTVEKVETTNGS